MQYIILYCEQDFYLTRILCCIFVWLVLNVTSTQIVHLWQAAREGKPVEEDEDTEQETIHTFHKKFSYIYIYILVIHLSMRV